MNIAYTGNAADLQSAPLFFGGGYDSFYPGTEDNPSASGNTVTVDYSPDGTNVPNHVFGGLSENDNASNNTVAIKTGEVNGVVLGGYSGKSSAIGNAVTTTSGGTIISGGIYGGSGNSGNTRNNTVTFSGGEMHGALYGGYGGDGETSNNAVTVNDGKVGRSIYGGASFGNATNNTVIINGGAIGINAVDASIIGGSTASNAIGNTVIVNGGEVGINITGGSAATHAIDNTVTVNGGKVGGNIRGGVATGNATGNTVTINDGEVNGDVVGGVSRTGNVIGNTVTINSGTYDGLIYGGNSYSGPVANNAVTINGGTFNSFLYGGNSWDGTAFGNTLTINSGTIDANAHGGFSVFGNTTGNTLIINGGTINDGVYGGVSVNGAANNNTATINGGAVGMFVAGAYSNVTANDNTINLGAAAQLDPAIELYGGIGGSSSTNNTINFKGWTGTIGRLDSAQHLNFLLPATVSGPVVTATNTVNLTTHNPDGDIDTTIGVTGITGGSAPVVGQKIALIEAGTLDGNIANPGATFTVKQGAFLDTTLGNLTQGTNDLTLEVVGASASEQTKALLEGRTGGVVLATQGQDMILNVLGSRMGAATTDGPFCIGMMQGGTSRYNTGSHVDVDGLNLIVGAGARKDGLAIGGFFEVGYGSYNTYNSFGNAPLIRGGGHTHYSGLGALGRYDLANGVYIDGSVRVGYSKTDFSSMDFIDAVGAVKADYDSGSMYCGLHAGLGYLVQINPRWNLDLATRYLWTQVASDEVTILNDPFYFDAVNSHRWRNGFRLNYTGSPQINPYIGLAYEYEWDGEAGGNVYGYDLKTPDLQGGTGIGEVGLSLKPTVKGNLTVDLALQGYVDTREGITGTAVLKYRF
ncbi:hypothetical protein [Desulfobulbus sp.]|uniref:hypothetical protein n=1 Tax=Desulfobulbus sp. TaxID=895 RepID=UPI00286F7D32|nr:hypothetical protein [Desulfobulbus sp.]